MRALDDILIGFFLFFAVDRLIRLLSLTVIEPIAERHVRNRSSVEGWKLAGEMFLLLLFVWLVFKNRKLLAGFNKA